jgi:hypothetical protein
MVTAASDQRESFCVKRWVKILSGTDFLGATVLLARLRPARQRRALGDEAIHFNGSLVGGEARHFRCRFAKLMLMDGVLEVALLRARLDDAGPGG